MHISSNGIILFCLVIFAVVGLFGQLSGYTTEGYVFDADGSRSPSGEAPTEDPAVDIPWWNFWDQGVEVLNGIIDTAEHVITAVPGLGFLFAIAMFSVPGMPVAITLILYLLGVILVISATRVIAGLVTGGGD